MSQGVLRNSFTYKGVLFQGSYTEESVLNAINYEGSDEDIYLSTYPRSGTTWTQNILIGLCFGTSVLAKLDHPDTEFYFPYLEIQYPDGTNGHTKASRGDISPKFIKTHLPVKLASSEILSKERKNILVFRNPKDVALSLHKYYQTRQMLIGLGNFQNLPEFLDLFLEGKVMFGSWWDWTKKWVEKARQHPETHLIIHYEDYHERFEECVEKLIKFIGVDGVSKNTVQQIKGHASFDSMKKRYKRADPARLNQGKMYTWKSDFPQEYTEKFDNLTKAIFKDDDELLNKFL